MNERPLKYISYYDTQDSNIRRNYVTSCTNKMEYIARTIASTGRNVEIISASEVTEPKFRFYCAEAKDLTDCISIKLPPSWGGKNIILRKFCMIWHYFYLIFFLCLNVRKNESVLVYHSLGYFNAILLAKKLIGFRLILEVEEIYSDVSTMSPYWRKLEFKMFNAADAYILSTELLDEKINPCHKPSIVIYGSYQVEPKVTEKFNDGKIHAIYAGTFDPNKGGAQMAIAAAKFLPENYHVHICGFGDDKTIKEIQDQISDVSVKSKATITYDGMKTGKDFIEYLQKCHIGLSCQKPEGEYNNTSFPSKILTYMANGLAVVSIKIPVIEKSAICDYISFYSGHNALSISDAISHAHKNTDDECYIIHKLNQSFYRNLKEIIFE